MLKVIENIEQKEIMPGFKGRFVHTNSSTIAFWEITKGAILPEHTDVVIRVEDITILNGSAKVNINKVEKLQNIHQSII